MDKDILKRLVKVALVQQKIIKKLASGEMTTLELAAARPDAYNALPEAYQADDVMVFYYDVNGNLCGKPKESEVGAVGDWDVCFNEETGKWDTLETFASKSNSLQKKAKKNQEVLNKLISKYSQQVLNPGQTAVDFDGSGAPRKVHDTVGDLKDPNQTNKTATESELILKNLTQTEQHAIDSLKVEGNVVKVKFKPGQGTDAVFNAVLKAVEKAIPYKAMSVREVV